MARLSSEGEQGTRPKTRLYRCPKGPLRPLQMATHNCPWASSWKGYPATSVGTEDNGYFRRQDGELKIV